MPEIDDVLAFWFGPPGEELAAPRRWFQKDEAFDRAIEQRFGPLLARADRGELDAWATGEGAARGALALVVLLDQMTRNVHRGKPGSFASDARALAICERGLASGLDRRLGWLERYVFQMPLMHAEDRAVARRSVEAFGSLAREAQAAGAPEAVTALLRSALDYAERHAVIVERFGRYPHRNAILGRQSSAEEEAFLQQPGSSF